MRKELKDAINLSLFLIYNCYRILWRSPSYRIDRLVPSAYRGYQRRLKRVAQ